MSAAVGVGVYSVQIHYSDGVSSPLIGKRKINSDATLQPGEIASTRVQHWAENYVQALTFLDANATILGSLQAQEGKGTTDECQVPPNQKIIGVYGYQDKNLDIRGLGFIFVEHNS